MWEAWNSLWANEIMDDEWVDVYEEVVSPETPRLRKRPPSTPQSKSCIKHRRLVTPGNTPGRTHGVTTQDRIAVAIQRRRYGKALQMLWHGPGHQALKRFFWTQVRQEGKSCCVSHLQTTLSQDALENFVLRGCIGGFGGGIAIIESCHQRCFSWYNRVSISLLWANTFSYV